MNETIKNETVVEQEYVFTKDGLRVTKKEFLEMQEADRYW